MPWRDWRVLGCRCNPWEDFLCRSRRRGRGIGNEYTLDAMEKVFIFGARGYLGSAFREVYPEASCPAIDIADACAVRELLEREKPAIVINAAGKTGRPNIDWCETHKEETLRSNLTGPLVLLEECQRREIYWVHLSSGCIYEGDNGGKGFTEEDPPNFFGSFYSRVKGWTDQILREFPLLILRLRMPFDGSRNERNLLVKLQKYTKILDVQNSITYLPDFLEAARTLITRRRTGIYNIVNPGTISPYEIMEMYKKCVQKNHTLERLSLESLFSVVRAARSNCVLSTEKLRAEGITLPDVHTRVEEALRAMIPGRPPLPC